jgi:hypothetical protein
MKIRQCIYIPEKNTDISKKSKDIVINTKNTNNTNNTINTKISQTENIFDPSKQSPPNDFLIKLQNRIGNYTLGIK